MTVNLFVYTVCHFHHAILLSWVNISAKLIVKLLCFWLLNHFSSTTEFQMVLQDLKRKLSDNK